MARSRSSFWESSPFLRTHGNHFIQLINGSWFSILLIPPIALFSFLIPLKLDNHVEASWYLVFTPLWIFNGLLLLRTLANLVALYFSERTLRRQIPAQSVFSSSLRRANFVTRILQMHDSDHWRVFNVAVCLCWVLLGLLMPVYLDSPDLVSPTLLFVLFLASIGGVVAMSPVVDEPLNEDLEMELSTISESEVLVFRDTPSRGRILPSQERQKISLFMGAAGLTGFLWWLRLERFAEPSFLIIFMPLLTVHLLFIVFNNPSPSGPSALSPSTRRDFGAISTCLGVLLIIFELLLIECLSNESTTLSFTVAFIPLFLLTFSACIFVALSCILQTFLLLMPRVTQL